MYTIVNTLSTIKQVEPIEKKKFIVIALDLNNKNFIVYIDFFTSSNLGLEICSSYKTQIISLKTNEVLISVFFKYINLIDIFSKKFNNWIPKIYWN